MLILHETLKFERHIQVNLERVFEAYADFEQRAIWGTPSESAVIIYDEADFREGGSDRFRCGAKSNPNIHVKAQYLSIVPGSRIVWSEITAMDGKSLSASLNTVTFRQDGNDTQLGVTVQIASFVGQDMINGHRQGNAAALDNLASWISSDERVTQ